MDLILKLHSYSHYDESCDGDSDIDFENCFVIGITQVFHGIGCLCTCIPVESVFVFVSLFQVY